MFQDFANNILFLDEGDNLHGTVEAKIGLARNDKENLTYGCSFVLGQEVKNIDFLISGSYNTVDYSGLKAIDLPIKNSNNTYAFYYKNLKTNCDMSKPLSFFGKINYKNKKIGYFSIDGNLQHINYKDAQFQDWHAKHSLAHNNVFNFYNMYIRGNYKKKYLTIFKVKLPLLLQGVNLQKKKGLILILITPMNG